MGESSMRVKIYELSAQSLWQDRGTGYCSCLFIDSINDYCLVVHAESDESILLSSPVMKEDQYQKQQDSLIVWSDKGSNSDLALSFQEPASCADIWGKICEIQLQHKNQGQELEIWFNPSKFEMPTPSIGTLPKILDLLKQSTITQYRRDLIMAYIHRTKYLDQLIPVFETCEDLEAIDDLHILCRIMKHINDIIIPVVGMFEYDPDFPSPKVNHRAHLSDPARFKEVIPLEDPVVKKKIHFSFRLQYLKDAVLVGLSDEGICQGLNTKIFYYNMEIVVSIENNHEFLGRLVEIVKSPDEPESKKHDVVLFIQQLCFLTKSFQPGIKSNVYRALSQNGLFDVLEYAMTSDSDHIRLVACELITTILEFDRLLVRSYILAQAKQGNRPLVKILAETFTSDKSSGVQMQCFEILRVLLDVLVSGVPDAMQSALIEGVGGTSSAVAPTSQVDSETEQFVSLFYETCSNQVAKPILSLTAEQVAELHHLPAIQAQVYVLVCELLTFCIRQHSFRSRFFVLSGTVVEQLGLLLTARVKHIQLAALRFFRACVGTTDNFVIRYLIRKGILERIMVLFDQNKGRYNLLNSACLDFFEFVTLRNLKPIITHLARQYTDQLTEGITYTSVTKQLLQRFGHNMESQRLLEDRRGSGGATSNLTDGPASSTSDDINGATDSPGLMKRHRLPRRPPPTAPPSSGWSTETIDDDEGAYFDTSDGEDNSLGDSPVCPTAPKPPATPTTHSKSKPKDKDLEGDAGELVDKPITPERSPTPERDAEPLVGTSSEADEPPVAEFKPMPTKKGANEDGGAKKGDKSITFPSRLLKPGFRFQFGRIPEVITSKLPLLAKSSNSALASLSRKSPTSSQVAPVDDSDKPEDDGPLTEDVPTGISTDMAPLIHTSRASSADDLAAANAASLRSETPEPESDIHNPVVPETDTSEGLVAPKSIPQAPLPNSQATARDVTSPCPALVRQRSFGHSASRSTVNFLNGSGSSTPTRDRTLGALPRPHTPLPITQKRSRDEIIDDIEGDYASTIQDLVHIAGSSPRSDSSETGGVTAVLEVSCDSPVARKKRQSNPVKLAAGGTSGP
ncbi:Platinum sensitivity protein [Dimargaris cristalligena]|nr:Platinum sensitivity protein [Dimargaris cristalligena]